MTHSVACKGQLPHPQALKGQFWNPEHEPKGCKHIISYDSSDKPVRHLSYVYHCYFLISEDSSLTPTNYILCGIITNT